MLDESTISHTKISSQKMTRRYEQALILITTINSHIIFKFGSHDWEKHMHAYKSNYVLDIAFFSQKFLT
jgi:hypothetical protein